MKIYGLTGGIASGKSTTTAILKEKNIPVIDADEIAREVCEPGMPALKAIRERFGDSYFAEDGALDRAKLGELVFNDADARRALNKITHPEISKTMAKRVLQYFLQGHRFIFMDVPLLFEVKALRFMCSKVICVYCEPDQELDRLMKRNGYTREEAESRIATQIPLAEKARLSDIVIDNSRSLAELRAQVDKLVDDLQPSFVAAHWFQLAAAVLLASVVACTVMGQLALKP